MSQKNTVPRNYYLTSFLSQFNPFMVGYAVLQLYGHLCIYFRYRFALPNKENFSSNISYSLPFQGTWMTVNGGTSRENSHSWDILTQRYAYDFLQVDERGESFTGEGKYLSDYSIDWKTKDFRGNFVIIQHGPREFSFFAYLKKNSLMVDVGDQVHQGQLIGLCGNSGHSTEPHIHFHLQDRKNFWTAMGLPIRFEKYSIHSETDTPYKVQDFVEKGEKIQAEVEST